MYYKRLAKFAVLLAVTTGLVMPASVFAKKTCPKGKFSTTGKWRGCKCKGGGGKIYSGVFKSHAKCRRGSRAKCPPGRFATTGRYHNCKCPKGSKKRYTNFTKSHATCRGHRVNCPRRTFKTTGRYRNCKCPKGTFKDWTSPLKDKARCKRGVANRKACRKKRGYRWYGIDSKHGVCIKSGNITHVHRQAYYAYFKNVRKGVRMYHLPSWFVKKFQKYYKKVNLKRVRIGVSRNTPSKNTAITDCQKIYFTPRHGVVRAIRKSEAAVNRTRLWGLIFHEIQHSNQCMGKRGGGGSTKRDRYADMWFKQLPKAIIVNILKGKMPDNKRVHDAMPMEKDAARAAKRIKKATGK